ncbi:hypothetical protein Sjap_018713 [Stephania japonica]|uniref:Uncharacterized protein n=1 Tax=Stephania japonica TaxID=461633 RepID=A0AAP0I8J2_9MAGN
MSAQETMPGQEASSCFLASSMTSKPLRRRFGNADFSVLGPLMRMEASQPWTKQSWKCILRRAGATDRLQRRCQELTQATPDQSVDDEAVYLNVAGECPKGRVYGLGSLGRKKRRYADPGASTSEMPDMVPRAEFNVVAEQLRKVMEFMQQHLGMNMDGAGLSQQQPPPPPAPPPHDQQQLSQIDPVDPPQQGDNVERETRWSGSVPRRYLALCGSGLLERNPVNMHYHWLLSSDGES